MRIDYVAQVIGYAVMISMSIILVAAILSLAINKAWKTFGEHKFMVEYIKWRRGK